MPIISFNISDNLKRFLSRMVNNKEYKNNSYVIRDALVRLMDEKNGSIGDLAALPQETVDVSSMLPQITSSILITIKSGNVKISRKLNKIENAYNISIVHRTEFILNEIRTITYVLEDSIDQIQMFITEINSLENLQSFRYIINESE